MEKTDVLELEDLLVKGQSVAVGRQDKKKSFRLPIRFWIAVMVFLTTYINYSTRVNMSISIVSMTIKTNNKSVPECKRHDNITIKNTTIVASKADPQYEWDEHIQGFIIGSYFWGYVITSLPGGWIAEWIGPFSSIFWAHIISAFINAGSVYGADVHVGILVATRFILGLCGGVIYPACQVLIARWAPPAEKGKFVSALMGNTLGTCLTWPIVGAITQAYGWSWGFYFISLQMLVFCLIFWFVASDSPDQHKWITEEEKMFILNSQGGSVSKKKAVPPYRAIFSSVPFWALCVLHFGNLWGLYLQLTGVPKFMTEVVGFNLKSAGGLAALPHLVRLFFGMGFGSLGDYLKSRKIASNRFIRKFFVFFSHIIPGLLLIGISFIGCNWMPIVALLTFSMAINGAAVMTNLQNPQDLAPNFAGSIFGIISFIGGMTGFITPAITGALTQENNGTKQWGSNFIIGGCVYITSGLIFILFGKVEQQSWNEKKEDPAVYNN